MIKVRAKFYKTGSMRFIGHLDIMRYFQKAFRRADIPVSYSQGFNPHQLLSFASPLGVGHTSEGEYLDIQMDREEDLNLVKNALNSTMTEELQITQMIRLSEESKTSMALLAGADYLLSVKDGYDFPDGWEEKFISFMNQEEILIIKKTKKSEQTINLKEYIYEYAFEKETFEKKTGHIFEEKTALEYDNSKKLYLQLTCGSVLNIKPELVMEEFLKSMDFPYNPYAFQVHRIEMYTDVNALKGEVNTNTEKDKRKLVSLDNLGV